MFCFKRQMWKWDSVQVHSISSVTSLRLFDIYSSPHCFQYPFLGNDVDNMFSDQGLLNLLMIFFFTLWSLLGVEESKSFVQFFFFYLVFRPFYNYYISPSQVDLKNSVKNERACLMSQWVTSQVMSQVTEHWKLKIVIGVKHWRWWLGWATDSKWLAFI